MPTLQELCAIVESSGSAAVSVPLQQACALPRSTADLAPLPEPYSEAAFDSSWEVLLSGVPAANVSRPPVA